jgi:hypothetical protein
MYVESTMHVLEDLVEESRKWPERGRLVYYLRCLRGGDESRQELVAPVALLF